MANYTIVSDNHILFNNNFKLQLRRGDIPLDTKCVQFNNSYNVKIPVDVIPFGVKKVIFGNAFNQRLKLGVLPNSVTDVTFGDAFNQPIKPGVLPNLVSQVIFGSCFNCSLEVGSLPMSLCDVYFGQDYNQVLTSGIIPFGTLNIKFGVGYCQSLMPNSFPFSVENLIFDKIHNSQQINVHPLKTVIILTTERDIDQHFINTQYLVVDEKISKRIVGDFSYYITKFLDTCVSIDDYINLIDDECWTIHNGKLPDITNQQLCDKFQNLVDDMNSRILNFENIHCKLEKAIDMIESRLDKLESYTNHIPII